MGLIELHQNWIRPIFWLTHQVLEMLCQSQSSLRVTTDTAFLCHNSGGLWLFISSRYKTEQKPPSLKVGFPLPLLLIKSSLHSFFFFFFSHLHEVFFILWCVGVGMEKDGMQISFFGFLVRD